MIKRRSPGSGRGDDRRKQNALVRDGWDPLRFTWHDLNGRPRSVLDEIQETVGPT